MIYSWEVKFKTSFNEFLIEVIHLILLCITLPTLQMYLEDYFWRYQVCNEINHKVLEWQSIWLFVHILWNVERKHGCLDNILKTRTRYVLVLSKICWNMIRYKGINTDFTSTALGRTKALESTLVFCGVFLITRVKNHEWEIWETCILIYRIRLLMSS